MSSLRKIRRPRQTRIVATVGPASCHPAMLQRLIVAGVDAVRLNFSHGTHAEHAGYIRTVRQIEERINKPICILQDLCGPKLRVGSVELGGFLLKRGQFLHLNPNSAPGDTDTIPVNVSNLASLVAPGQRILLDDGRLELRVIETEGERVLCRVVTGGTLLGHKGLNLPGCRIPLSGMTAKDWEDLAFGVAHDVDAVAISFVQSADDVSSVQQHIASLGGTQPVIAKIERAQAVENLEEIIRQADGVMVARGDMAVEISSERVPFIQKKIIDAAQAHGKVVVTATQMLESMVHGLQPTRAEVSDVANAALDGSDCLMLSAETASGEHPLEAVQTMARVAKETEKRPEASRAASLERLPDVTRLIAQSACDLADRLKARRIIVFSRSGATAILVSKCRPETPVVAVTPDIHVQRRLNLAFGLDSILLSDSGSPGGAISSTVEALTERGDLSLGNVAIAVYGQKMGLPGTTNSITVHQL